MATKKHIICSYKITAEIEANLVKLGFAPVKLRGLDKFGEYHPLNYHPDMFCFNLDLGLNDNTWIFYESAYHNNKTALSSLNLNLNIIVEPDPVLGVYPYHIGLNCAKIGGVLVCAEKYANVRILKSANHIIDVKQGYARCSVCAAGDAVITADKNIYKKFPGEKLLIRAGHIDLFGYNYGFIGGCSGFAGGALLFTGDIEAHPDYLDMKNFCENRGIGIIGLSKEKLRDYGGLLPLSFFR